MGGGPGAASSINKILHSSGNPLTTAVFCFFVCGCVTHMNVSDLLWCKSSLGLLNFLWHFLLDKEWANPDFGMCHTDKSV